MGGGTRLGSAVWRASGTLLVAVLLGSACEPRAEPVRPATRAAIVAVAQTPTALELATEKATERCMARAGFEYPPYRVLASQPMGETSSTLGGFQPRLTLGWAETHGYEGYISMRGGASRDPEAAEEAYLARLSEGDRERYARTLNDPGAGLITLRLPDGAEVGAAAEGCVAEGRRAVYGSVRNYLQLFYFPQQIAAFGQAAVDAPEVEDARSQYRACMRQAGFQVAGPSDAVDRAEQLFGGSRPPGSAPGDEERAMAVADARCRLMSRIHDALEAALVREASAWLNEHEGEILALADLQRAALSRARRILESEAVAVNP